MSHLQRKGSGKSKGGSPGQGRMRLTSHAARTSPRIHLYGRAVAHHECSQAAHHCLRRLLPHRSAACMHVRRRAGVRPAGAHGACRIAVRGDASTPAIEHGRSMQSQHSTAACMVLVTLLCVHVCCGNASRLSSAGGLHDQVRR